MRIIKNGDLIFGCDNDQEVYRVQTLYTKEEGTVKWINENIKQGDVFFDIGANIGLYTILAAKRGATVYAFEPHITNASNLIRNVGFNKLQDRVKVITSAVGHSEEYEVFNYNSTEAGSSGSQLGHTTGETGKEFTPVLKEIKRSLRIDDFCKLFDVYPTFIKLDVDGNELEVLRGVMNILDRVKQIQVEVHPKDRLEILENLRRFSFDKKTKHFTANGKKLLEAGKKEEEIIHNIIFSPSSELVHKDELSCMVSVVANGINYNDIEDILNEKV